MSTNMYDLQIEKEKTYRIQEIAYAIGKFAQKDTAHSAQLKAIKLLEEIYHDNK